MSELILCVESPADAHGRPIDDAPAWPWLADGRTEWAARLHDELGSRQARPTADDVARITSWLRVQLVGRHAVVVTEPRLDDYAVTWAAAAERVSVATVRLTRAAGAPTEPVEADPGLIAPIQATTTYHRSEASALNTLLARSRLWVLDRAEAAGRLAVRALQR